jgi:hypothetical protein
MTESTGTLSTPECSKRPSSKVAASEGARHMFRYVEPLSHARTPLEDFFSILLAPRFNLFKPGRTLASRYVDTRERSNLLADKAAEYYSPLPAMSSIRGRLISVQPMQIRSKSSSWLATKFFASTSFSFMTREWQVSQSIIRPRETPTVFLPVLPAISIRPILSAGP